MRILILSNNSDGLYKLKKELLLELVHSKAYIESNKLENNRVVISVPDDKRVKDLQDLGCEVYKTPMERRGKNPFKDIFVLVSYLRLIRKVNPDVILSFTIKPNIYGGLAARFRHKTFIPTVNGLGSSLQNDNLSSKFIKFLYSISFKKSPVILVQNESILDYFKKNVLKLGNYKLIPGSGINLNRFHFENYPDNTDKIIFITIGRIMRDKGIVEFLESVSRVKNKYGSMVEFYLIGAYDEPELKSLVDEYDKNKLIHYLGYRKDINKLVSKCNCVIHPSYHEGLSNVLLEAGATGRPVIASDVAGCRETFINGVSGLVVKAKDSEDLTRKIEEFINIPYEEKVQMGKANREYVEKNFDRKIVVEKYIECIEKYAK